jgi:hypothetical protein
MESLTRRIVPFEIRAFDESYCQGGLADPSRAHQGALRVSGRYEYGSCTGVSSMSHNVGTWCTWLGGKEAG